MMLSLLAEFNSFEIDSAYLFSLILLEFDYCPVYFSHKGPRLYSEEDALEDH